MSSALRHGDNLQRLLCVLAHFCFGSMAAGEQLRVTVS